MNKVECKYSIFICLDTPQIRADSIESYRIVREMVYGENPNHPRYDLLNAVIVNISKKRRAEEDENSLTAMLKDLLDENMGTEVKLTLLQEKHGIRMTEEIEEEVREMCTYTASVLAQGKRSAKRLEGRSAKRLDGRPVKRLDGRPAKRLERREAR